MSEVKQGQAYENEHHDSNLTELNREVEPHLHTKTYLIVFAVFVLNLTGVTTLTVSGAYARVIVAAIGGADKQSWIVNCILLPMVALAVPMSQAADYWGRRWILIVLVVFGFVGALITSRANEINHVLAGQTLIGLAFAPTAFAFAIPSEVLPHKHRMTAQVVPSLGNVFGALVGLVGGAALIDKRGPGGFRILFYIIAALYATTAILTFLCYNPPPRELQKTLTFNQKIRLLDWIGGSMLSIGLVLFCIGLSWAQNPYAWSSAHVLSPLCVGIAVLIFFCIYEWRFKTDGMLNHRLFARDKNLALAMLGIFFEGFIYMSGNVYLPTQVAILYESRTIMVGFNFGISWIAYFFSALAAAAYCYRYKKLRVVVVCGFTCFMIFNICMATTQLRSGKAIWAYPIFFGLGLALCLSALVSFAQFSAPPDIIIIASALVSTFRGVGATIGTATFAALFEAKFTKLMPERIAAAVIPLGLPESSLLPLIGDLVGGETEQLATVKGATPEIIHAAVKGLKIAYIDSFRFVWIMAAVLSAVAGAVSLLFKDYKEDFNLKIDAPAESEEALYGDIVHKEKV